MITILALPNTFLSLKKINKNKKNETVFVNLHHWWKMYGLILKLCGSCFRIQGRKTHAPGLRAYNTGRAVPLCAYARSTQMPQLFFKF